MKTITTLIISGIFLLASCSKSPLKEPEIPGNDILSSKAQAGSDLNFTEENLFPEGVVYDKFNDRFYVSSTTRGDIGIVDRNGSYTPFITDPELIGTTGLEIDESRKLLFVSNSTNGSVAIYNINTGQLVRFVDLKPLLPGAPVFINDKLPATFCGICP